ncbi:MAG: ATP-binding cassette domain-containing protein [Clostridiales bacterium]|nr:ATP-binding cassette domain-containing protein [Candidatus Scatonaster coprocaballi]
MSEIVLRNLSKSYGENPVISDLNLNIKSGVTTCLMGPSGCGKTTLLRLIAGLEKPDSGEIMSEARKISYVFQEDRLSEDFSVISNIRFVVGKTMNSEDIRNLLKEFELGDVIDKPVRELSGGMKRRVAIARALSATYDLLILDEPLKGLDEKLKQHVMEVIKNHTKGKTVIYVTHDSTEADVMGARVICLEKT